MTQDQAFLFRLNCRLSLHFYYLPPAIKALSIYSFIQSVNITKDLQHVRPTLGAGDGANPGDGGPVLTPMIILQGKTDQYLIK